MTSPGLLTKLIGGLIFLLFLFFIFRASKSHQEQQLRITQLMNQMTIENEKINSTKPMMEIISVEPVPMENTPPTSAVPSPVPIENTPPTSAVISPVRIEITPPVSEEVVEDNIEVMVISKNGRCGPINSARGLEAITLCPGKQCCSRSHWCSGTQGTKSGWCFKGGKGQKLGKYDGLG